VIALDLSRLLSRARSVTPTGIDRVEMAYARYLIQGDAPYCFTARNVLGAISLLPTAGVREFIIELAAMWRDGAGPVAHGRMSALARRLKLAALLGESAPRASLGQNSRTPVYLSVSHQNLDRPRSIARLKATTGARFVCLIHDLIPLEFPILTRPAQTSRHRRRIDTAAALADAVITNSAATRDALRKRLGSRAPRITVAPLGVDPPEICPSPTMDPYFVCIGTIEARKNHRLLLDLWQRLVTEMGDRAPRLILIGQRGFGSSDIADRLRGLSGPVTERPNLPDMAMTALLSGARALLLPSLAEGFGLPVAEALSAGVPVLCSDLPALRESGGGVPEYLEPTDIAAWHQAVVDYTADTPRRAAQMQRLVSWQPPTWAAHFAIVERVIAELGQAPR
jgi:glycosyltransferase involved in cell wall biosynthesis